MPSFLDRDWSSGEIRKLWQFTWKFYLGLAAIHVAAMVSALSASLSHGDEHRGAMVIVYYATNFLLLTLPVIALVWIFEAAATCGTEIGTLAKALPRGPREFIAVFRPYALLLFCLYAGGLSAEELLVVHRTMVERIAAEKPPLGSPTW